MTLVEIAENDLASELQFHSQKYIFLSNLVGANVWLFTHHFMKLRLYWYVSLPVSLGLAFLSRNLVMKNCVDRIYYPG